MLRIRSNPPSNRSRQPVVLACLAALGALAGAGLFTFQDARGLSYLSDDPAACANCHVMREVFDGWQKGPHHAVAVCNDCHTPHDLVGKYWVKTRNGWHHSSAFTLQNYPETIRIKPANARVLQDNCVRCHAEMVAGIGATAAEPADDVACARCHEGVGHGPVR